MSTGSEPYSGTESKISLTLYDRTEKKFEIESLASIGLMGPSHKYFQDGALDIFSGKGECLTGPICGMNLTSDGSGPGHKWFCNYIDVTMAAPHGACTQKSYRVELWFQKDPNPELLQVIASSCSSLIT